MNQEIIDDISAVIADLEARGDYGTTTFTVSDVTDPVSATDAVATFTTYKQAFLTSSSSDAQSQSADILALIAAIINANTLMMKMGALNVARTIEPTTAQTHNAHLQTLQTAVMQEPADATLKGLELIGALQTDKGASYQFYSDTQNVQVIATTDPNTTAAWQDIVWSGGEETASGDANQRAVPLNVLNTQGTQTTISATLNGTTQSVSLTVMPKIASLSVIDATTDGDGNWTAASGADTVLVRAITSPDTSAAHDYLSWSGGDTSDKGANYRQVSADSLPTDGTTPVTATIKLTQGA